MGTPAKRISEKIKAYMKENGITQISIAKKIGITPAKLSLSLLGKRGLTIQEFEQICIALKNSPNNFVGGEKQWKKTS